MNALIPLDKVRFHGTLPHSIEFDLPRPGTLEIVTIEDLSGREYNAFGIARSCIEDLDGTLSALAVGEHLERTRTEAI